MTLSQIDPHSLDVVYELAVNRRFIDPAVVLDLIAQLRHMRGDVQWLMQAVLDRTEWTAPDGCPEHQCEFTTNPEKGACSFHEQWFGIADRYDLLEWLGPEAEL